MVDRNIINLFSLPKFQLIDGRARVEMAVSKPAIFIAPLLDFFDGPTFTS